jgi:hypothetical protein
MELFGNDWFNKATGKICIVRRDASVKTLGEGTDKEGAMSPKTFKYYYYR